MRSTVAGLLLLATSALVTATGIEAAGAAECAPGALGVSRTIVIDPTEHQLLGSMQYKETLPLKDREVVLTFDDGPLPPYTNRVLDILAAECVKATFFLVGRMVRGYPSIVRRIYNEGHTIANHSQNHPFTFHKMTTEQASTEIEDGFSSLRTALGDPKAVSPFFRIPGLLRQTSVEQYLSSHGYMTWSVDLVADDWLRLNNEEIAKRAITRLEARGRGILLLHDIQPATALAFPEIMRELKARGFKIVHVVPATPDRPKTVTEPEHWAVRRVTPEQKIWPRTLVKTDGPAPVLSAPMPTSFGIESFGPRGMRLALAPTFERPSGEAPPPAPWPQATAYTVPTDADVLPIPGRQNFRYRPARLAAKKPPAPRKPLDGATATAAAKPNPTSAKPKDFGGILGLLPSRPVGHQLTVARPPTNISPAPR